MAILIPLTFRLDPIGAMIMLARYLLRRHVRRFHHLGAHQRAGGSRLGRDRVDGYQMARQGRGGTALGMAAIGRSSAAWWSSRSSWLRVARRGVVQLFGRLEFGADAAGFGRDQARRTVLTAGSAMAVLVADRHGRHRRRRGVPRLTFGIEPRRWRRLHPGGDGLFGVAEILLTIEKRSRAPP